MNNAIPEIDIIKCDGCGDCIGSCPGGAVAIVDGKATVINAELCTYCTDCEELCSMEAIRCPFEIVISLHEQDEK
ncbi:MAG: 4Fe-4S dicluster domain-containing protein [Dehalococcoidia bacterium]|nr:4Fe-4S dicluster domain-containing protein [Dehalococcoidia bacterium]